MAGMEKKEFAIGEQTAKKLKKNNEK